MTFKIRYHTIWVHSKFSIYPQTNKTIIKYCAPTSSFGSWKQECFIGNSYLCWKIYFELKQIYRPVINGSPAPGLKVADPWFKQHFQSYNSHSAFWNVWLLKWMYSESKNTNVSGFLCSGDCYLPETTVEQSLVHILTTVGSTKDVSNTLLPFLELNPRWADCLDKNQVNN